MSLGGLPGPSTEQLGPRFNLVSLFPTTALVLFVLLLVRSGAATGEPRLDRLAPGKLLGGDQALANIAYLSVAVVAIALILYPFQISLTRVLEGYWGDSGVARAVGAIGREIHRRRRERLETTIRRQQRSRIEGEGDVPTEAGQAPMAGRPHGARIQLATYPAENRLLPTRLGNVLRSTEDRAGQRYNLDTVIMWPRLYSYVSGPLAQALAEDRRQLDASLRLSAVLLLATFISAAILLTDGFWLIIPGSTALLSWMAYQAAVRTALKYGQSIYVAFDAYRFDMLRGLHYPLPATLKDELDFNKQLVQFFDTKRPLYKKESEHRYEHDGGNASAITVTQETPTVRFQAIAEFWRRRTTRERSR
jgi:hypothetical protein